VFAVVSEGRVYRPSTLGPALTISAGTDGARRRQVVSAPVFTAMFGLYTLEKTLNPKIFLSRAWPGLQIFLFPCLHLLPVFFANLLI
jgi:hypothetical protein